MKKLTYIASVAALSMSMASCENFLDADLVTAQTSDNFPTTETQANDVLTGIYAHMLFEDPETSSSTYLAQLAADECLGGNLSQSNNCATNFMMYTGNLNGHSDLWSRCYTLIHRANSALESFKNVTSWSSQSEENRHYGEAYFLRGLAYYELAQVFGGVPLRTSTSTDNLPRASVDEVYSQIADDMKQAIELLPAVNYIGSSLDGHTNKYIAEAYMARMFLFYTGRYGKDSMPNGVSKSDVITWIDDCVNNSGYELVSDQRNIWAYTNSATNGGGTGTYQYDYAVNNGLSWEGNGCKETLFANKHNLKSTWTYTWWSNTVAQFYSPSGDNNDLGASYPFGSGWGAGPVSPAFVDEWKAWSNSQTFTDPNITEDPRLTGSIWSYRAFDPNNAGNVLFDRRLSQDEPDYTVSYRYFEQTGYFNKKYINILAHDGQFKSFGLIMYPGLTNQTSQSLTQIQDLVLMRFADVLLMQSELKQDATGLNRVRARSGLAPVSYSLQAIKDERRYELAFESIRWWDILRWSGPSLAEAGELLNKQTGFTLLNAAEEVPMCTYDYAKRLQETQGYWNIPQTEIDMSEGLLEQNPGWDGAHALFNDWSNM